MSRRCDPAAGAPEGVAAGLPAAFASPTRASLPNGLTIVFHENHANPTVAIQGLVKAGAMYDPSGKSGLASFVAAMLNRGTSSRTAYQQAEAIEDVGASLHFEGGAETISISAGTLSEELGTVLEVLADALRNPAFAPDQIEKARDEHIVQVRIHEEDTGVVASRTANEILYPAGHPFHFSPIGTEPSLRGITREDLCASHAAHYGPQTTILVLAGDVDPATALDPVRAVFGDWKCVEGLAPFAVPDVEPPSAMERRTVTLQSKSQVDVVYATTGLARTAPDYYAAMIMNYILGGGSLSSRLMDDLRDNQGLVYGVYSNLNAGIGAGPLQVRAGTNPANTERTVRGILEHLARMHEEGPAATELAEAKSYLTGVFPVRLEKNSAVASQLLGAELYGLGMDYIERYGAVIRAVTLDEVRAAAKRYVRPNAGALAIVGSYGPGEAPRLP